jgi:hypothetical protein
MTEAEKNAYFELTEEEYDEIERDPGYQPFVPAVVQPHRKALEAADTELLVHPIVTIPSADWGKFKVWANAPAKLVPALRDISATKPVWRD